MLTLELVLHVQCIGYYWRFGLGRICIKLFLTQVCKSFIFFIEGVDWGSFMKERDYIRKDQRTNGPVNAHLISWPSKAQNKQNLENIW